jgi:hypothetical protein
LRDLHKRYRTPDALYEIIPPYVYLNEYSLYESEADEDDEAGDEVEDEADGALRVQADQHHALPAEAVRQRPEDNTAETDATKV